MGGRRIAKGEVMYSVMHFIGDATTEGALNEALVVLNHRNNDVASRLRRVTGIAVSLSDGRRWIDQQEEISTFVGEHQALIASLARAGCSVVVDVAVDCGDNIEGSLVFEIDSHPAFLSLLSSHGIGLIFSLVEFGNR